MQRQSRQSDRTFWQKILFDPSRSRHGVMPRNGALRCRATQPQGALGPDELHEEASADERSQPELQHGWAVEAGVSAHRR
jgi:hypothetical protein